ncbi:MAG TPA: magnesium transporter [Gemmatimonadaceae bacterium]
MSRSQLFRQLTQAAIEQYPAEAAVHLEDLAPQDTARILEQQRPDLAAAMLRALRADYAADVVSAFSATAASAILGRLEPAVAAALVSRLDPEAGTARLQGLDPALARELTALLTYPAGVAGAIMDPRVTSFRPDATARQALTRLRALRHKAIHNVFLVDADGRLTGTVGIQDLALAGPATKLEDLALPFPPRVQALAPHEDLIAIVEERKLSSIPVVDISDRLIGVVRHADLLAATQRDATADLQTMVGVSKEERALSSPVFAVRKRLPWLQINLATAFLASAVVALFESTIAQFTALAVLLPVVAGQSGNTGAQALAVTMRGLALREIRVRHWFRVARKELVAGATNGIAVALVTALGVWAWSRSPGLAAVIGGAMVLSMTIAGVAGASVPMALIRLGQDPAAASSIVLTTVTDVMGFLTFLGFATLASGWL